MATLYVENVPKDLYEALRGRARARRRSIAKEVLALLEESIPTQEELKARQALLHKLDRMRSKHLRSRRAFPSTEEMQREDRVR
jgi:plasmid stability protein